MIGLKIAWKRRALPGGSEELQVQLRGSLQQQSCGCLEHFFARHGEDVVCMRIDLDELDADDGAGVAVLTTLLRELLDRGGEITLVRAPQMLAHTLYKTGMLRRYARLHLEDVQQEEPYG